MVSWLMGGFRYDKYPSRILASLKALFLGSLSREQGWFYRQEVNFRRRGPMQLASTLGFILNKRSGKFLGLTPEEQAALHECLTWWALGGFPKKTWVRG